MYSSTLFPPVFNQTYVPAFIYTQKCRVYFSLSKYNSIESMLQSAVQVVVRNQKTNVSVLNTDKYPSGIKITSLGIDNKRETDDKYYIQVKSSDIRGGFNLNEYYKVQIRFTEKDATRPPTNGRIDGWLNLNLNYFSEWSRVVLIRGISMPVLTGIEEEISIQTNDYDLTGGVTFSSSADNETLRSYTIQLYKDDVLLQKSGILYSQNNEIKYPIKRYLQTGQTYIIKIQIITENLYSWDKPKEITLIVSEQEQEPVLDINLRCITDNRTGSIKLLLCNKYNDNYTKNYFTTGKGEQTTLNGREQVLSFTEPDTSNFLRTSILTDDAEEILFLLNINQNSNPIHDLSAGNSIVIKRSSSKDDFTTWETLENFEITKNSIKNALWSDYTVEPGIWYRYIIIRYNAAGTRTASIQIPKTFMVHSEDIFLSGGGKQLNVRFDPQITNFSIKTSESLVETIGSKYPYIRRNGNINYKTFNLSGTISCFTDLKSNLMKASKEDVYKNSKYLYDEYNINNNITLYKDDIYERMFRDKVIEFLQENNVKLFRSTTEGNILVKLMNISFSPNMQLNRHIYSFSCTANEIAECNFDNFKKYKIFDVNSIKYDVDMEGD